MGFLLVATKDIELKPCPYCGNSNISFLDAPNQISGNGVLYLRCCATMEMPYIMNHYIRKNSRNSREKVKEKLFKKWNTRTKEEE